MKADIYTNIVHGIFEIAEETSALFSVSNHAIMMYDLQISFQSSNQNVNTSDLVIKFISRLEKINSRIKELNKDVSKLDSDFIKSKVTLIKFSKEEITKEIERIFKKIDVDKKSSDIAISNVRSQLSEMIRKRVDDAQHQCLEIMGYCIDKQKGFKKGVPKKFQNQISEVIDLLMIGYKLTALLVLGRIFEELFNNLINKNFRKINYNGTKKELLEETFIRKLNILNQNKIISHKDWLILSKVIWDRNTGGHFINDNMRKLEAEKESESTARLSIPLIKKYYIEI